MRLDELELRIRQAGRFLEHLIGHPELPDVV